MSDTLPLVVAIDVRLVWIGLAQVGEEPKVPLDRVRRADGLGHVLPPRVVCSETENAAGLVVLRRCKSSQALTHPLPHVVQCLCHHLVLNDFVLRRQAWWVEQERGGLCTAVPSMCVCDGGIQSQR